MLKPFADRNKNTAFQICCLLDFLSSKLNVIEVDQKQWQDTTAQLPTATTAELPLNGQKNYRDGRGLKLSLPD